MGALACPSEAAEPLSAEVLKQLQTFEFREPYRMDGVQSFGEKQEFRRTIARLCRSGVRSSNEKSLLLRAYLPTSSPGEYAASCRLAEREGFELAVRSFGAW
jgi:hypothetical protein